MAASGYFHAYHIVQEAIARFENLHDPFEIDGLIMRLDYLNRFLVNLDSDINNSNFIFSNMVDKFNYLNCLKYIG